MSAIRPTVAVLPGTRRRCRRWLAKRGLLRHSLRCPGSCSFPSWAGASPARLPNCQLLQLGTPPRRPALDFMRGLSRVPQMGKLPLIAAVASAMWALPASARDVIPSKAEVALAQWWYLCVGPDCFDQDRDYWQGYDWRYYRGGACREVTFNEWRGNEVVVRHARRCD